MIVSYALIAGLAASNGLFLPIKEVLIALYSGALMGLIISDMVSPTIPTLE